VETNAGLMCGSGGLKQRHIGLVSAILIGLG